MLSLGSQSPLVVTSSPKPTMPEAADVATRRRELLERLGEVAGASAGRSCQRPCSGADDAVDRQEDDADDRADDERRAAA